MESDFYNLVIILVDEIVNTSARFSDKKVTYKKNFSFLHAISLDVIWLSLFMIIANFCQ